MTWQINPLVEREEYERHQRQERRYVAQLREKGLLIEMGNIAVDAEQLVLRGFQCNTGYCVACSGAGAALEYKGSCCTDLSVDITPHEKAKFEQLARMAKERMKFGADDPLLEIADRILEDRITELNEEEEESLIHRDTGRCVLSVMENGRLYCAINKFCHALGADLREFKADPCYLFPLHYGQFGPEDYILTVLCEETRFWVGQDRVVGKLKCMSAPEAGAPPAYQFLKNEIEYVLGEDFYRELDARAQPILEKFRAGEFKFEAMQAPDPDPEEEAAQAAT